MKLKKYITLLLSALMLVCAMTACGPSVEHRFDTEEYSARAEATMRSIAQQLGRVESLANGHGVELYAAFAEYEDGRPGRPDGDVTVTTVTQDALNDWAARPAHKLCIYAESGDEIEEYLAAWLPQVRQMYSALNSLTEEQWQGLAGGTLSLMGELVQQGGKTYVQASIACE